MLNPRSTGAFSILGIWGEGGGGTELPRHFPPNWARASGQKRAVAMRIQWSSTTVYPHIRRMISLSFTGRWRRRAKCWMTRQEEEMLEEEREWQVLGRVERSGGRWRAQQPSWQQRTPSRAGAVQRRKNGEACGLAYLDLLQGVRPLAAGDNQMERAFLEVGAADWQWQPPMEQVCWAGAYLRTFSRRWWRWRG